MFHGFPLTIGQAVIVLIAFGLGICLLARGLGWVADRASNWNGDLDR